MAVALSLEVMSLPKTLFTNIKATNVSAVLDMQ
jgi:hypothetical protein